MNEWVRGIGTAGLALTLGCSMLSCSRSPSSSVPMETVRGKVAYQGKPLPWGFLYFFNGTSLVGTGAIKPDGSGAYEAVVLAGPVQAIVKRNPGLDPDEMPAAVGAAMPPSRSQGSPPVFCPSFDAKQDKLLDEVQKKYGSLRTARPLTFVVGPGEQNWDINLD